VTESNIEEQPVVFEKAAQAHVSRNVPVVAPETPAGVARRLLEGRRFDSATELAVCQDGRLVGVLRIEDLFAAAAEAPVRAAMDTDPPVVAPGTDQEQAAWRAVRHRETSLAVVDEKGRFLGFIPPQRLLAVLLHEHEEDLARLGGFLRGTGGARRQ
jgi:magnesium transporter